MKKNNDNNVIFNDDYNNNYLSKSALNNLLGIQKQNNKLITTKKHDVNLQKEKITIIIPTHNRTQQLSQCIDSICSQTYQNFEIIIIDDCSTDDTNKIFSNHSDTRIRYYLNDKNLGMGLNRQKAYNLSKGDYVIFIDDDDYYIDNDFFTEAMEIFKDDAIDMICSNSYIHYESEDRYASYKLNIYGKQTCQKYLEGFQYKYLKPTSGFPTIFRKRILEKGDFSNMKMMNDASIYLRALTYGNYVYFNKKIIGIYRMHTSNDTFNVKADFTIENLEEKKKIYTIVKNRIRNNKLWFFNEIKITVCHFLIGREKNKEEINKVLNWTKNNVGFLAYVYYKLYKKIYNIKKIMVRY